MELTVNEARRLFEYEAATGILRWRVATGRRPLVGMVAGKTSSKDGYRIVRIYRREYRVHRVIWLLVYGSWPSHQIDHINHNKVDNRLANLRDVPATVNQQNQKNPKGYHRNKSGTRYQTQIRVGGKSIHVGMFKTEAEAHAAYLKAKRVYHPSAPIPAL